ncbi:hypothetical protein DXV76_02535 [Rhodobacteraceae bacterium CCMM004]|nr:hypothetical protein DXV76_02535 [Rhodobacteraceae bacterium CCMM004]
MRRIAPTLLAALLVAAPLSAQETPEGDMSDGADLLKRGAELFFRGLLDEVEPKMQEMAEALKEWNLHGLTIDDIDAYHPPEKLPNGDIIIRRKVPLDPLDPGPEGDEIEI